MTILTIYIIGALIFAVLAFIGAGAFAAYSISEDLVEIEELVLGTVIVVFGVACSMWLWPALFPAGVGYLGYEWYRRRSANK